MTKITAIIVVKGSPPQLAQSLESISFAYEIIIGAIDLDPTIRKQLESDKKFRVIDIKDVPFADLVKEDLKQKATGDYILYLDPDEIFPKAAADELTGKNQYDYFLFPRKNMIFGKWIKHSRWWPDYQLRFFRKKSVIWPKTLHPIPEKKGNGYTFPEEEKFAIFHYNYENLDHFLEKAIRYAKFEAQEIINNKKDYGFQQASSKAISEFMSRFFADEGFKDGMHGLVLSFLQMFYYFLVYFFFWEGTKYAEPGGKVVPNAHHFFSKGNKEANHWVFAKKLTSFSKRLKLKIVNKLLE